MARGRAGAPLGRHLVVYTYICIHLYQGAVQRRGGHWRALSCLRMACIPRWMDGVSQVKHGGERLGW